MTQHPPDTGPQLTTAPAVLRATVQITRAATGKVDTFEIVGTPIAIPDPALTPQPTNAAEPAKE